MNALYSLVAVLALVLAGAVGAETGAGRTLLTLILPYMAFAVFLAGFCWRVLRWAWTPVPFRIPVTCGQQKSLPWIKTAWVDNPSTGWGVVVRMAGEILLFRSLFRNNSARLRGERLQFGEDKYMWLAALAFHWALLMILLRHLRLLVEHVPAFVNGLERLDGFFQIGAPQVYLSDAVLLGALAYLIARRFRDPLVRYISLFTDYFALLLAAGNRSLRRADALFCPCGHQRCKAVCAGRGRLPADCVACSGSGLSGASAAGVHAGGVFSFQQADARGRSISESRRATWQTTTAASGMSIPGIIR